MYTEALCNVINTIPDEYLIYLKYKILVLPIKVFMLDYEKEKENLIKSINNMSNAEINSMHKWSFENPLNRQKCNELNELIYPFVREYHKLFNRKYPEYFCGFSIVYNNAQKKLDLHTDDSFYTVNMCLKNTVTDNEVVFLIKNREIAIPCKEDHMIIHLGDVPHYTKKLSSGNRTNIVMWFK